eukprot:CAMPEP_0119567276 /NCGR_PEP_ID=MMETSP1352-20130426/35447_1 /TAXON_ID=265584 /ORGANISM="Stauroneis constricta, Strain CCMP1120" /LENGTH=64 /DNA_ID=CAMNT_0007616513 /DNA_START=57 /DNA_END=247 /DNA_ORIENTATION=-
MRAMMTTNVATSILALMCAVDRAWSWGGGSDNQFVESNYGNLFAQDWMYDSSGLSMKVEGCVWA